MFFEAAFDCAFEAFPDNIFGADRPGVLYGHDAYQSKCCKLCIVCDSSSKRVDNKWLKCEGYSTSDTEGVNCVSKCQSGYYDSNATAPGEADPRYCRYSRKLGQTAFPDLDPLVLWKYGHPDLCFP